MSGFCWRLERITETHACPTLARVPPSALFHREADGGQHRARVVGHVDFPTPGLDRFAAPGARGGEFEVERLLKDLSLPPIKTARTFINDEYSVERFLKLL